MPNALKGQNSKHQSGIRKGLLVKKVPAEKMGDLMVPQILLALWNRFRVFKGLGNRYSEVPMGQVSMEEPWNLAIYSKGASLLHLLGQLDLGF